MINENELDETILPLTVEFLRNIKRNGKLETTKNQPKEVTIKLEACSSVKLDQIKRNSVEELVRIYLDFMNYYPCPYLSLQDFLDDWRQDTKWYTKEEYLRCLMGNYFDQYWPNGYSAI